MGKGRIRAGVSRGEGDSNSMDHVGQLLVKQTSGHSLMQALLSVMAKILMPLTQTLTSGSNAKSVSIAAV